MHFIAELLLTKQYKLKEVTEANNIIYAQATVIGTIRMARQILTLVYATTLTTI